MLIDSATDAHLWAEKYTGTLEDVFALQEQMSRRIVEGLRLKLTPEEDRRLAARPIPDIRAYDAWLRGSQAVWAFTKEGFDRAYELVNHALEWLERAIAWGFSNHRFLSEHSRFLAPLRGDPRFQTLVDRARGKERAVVV